MRIVDPGHQYALDHLDGSMEELLTFVKREGEGYPGNEGSHPGTNLQEVIRVLIDRVKYLHSQIAHDCNLEIIDNLRECIRLLEQRAAERHGRNTDFLDYCTRTGRTVETLPTCIKCGHVLCDGACH